MSAISGDKGKRLRIRFSDKESLQEVRTILAYEAGVRGLNIGQALCEIVIGAVRFEDYPEELRERLQEIEKESKERAVEKSLEMSQ